MATKRDYYEVLGVTRTATRTEIAASYRKLAIKYHPDKNPGNQEVIAHFKEIAEAFEVLNDDDKRSRYDRGGHQAVDGQTHQFNDINEIFSMFGDLFGFQDMFGGGGRGGKRVRKGADVGCEVTIDLLEAHRGVTKFVKFERHEKCETCDGHGSKPGSKPQGCQYCGGRGQVLQSTGIFRVQTTCPVCSGTGSVVKEQDRCGSCRGQGFVAKKVERELAIPAGVDNDMRLRLTGEGEPSPDGGPPGDCYCLIHVRNHPLFQREGLHLICQVPITYSQAALGTDLEVPTLDGPHKLTITAGTQPGDVYKLKGRGFKDPRGRSVGDQLVQVNLEVPKKLSQQERELLEQLAHEEKVNVSAKRKNFIDRLKDFFVPLETAEEK